MSQPDRAFFVETPRYLLICEEALLTQKNRVIIIGGGLAGLACGSVLHDAGVPFRILDKGRGPGGRLSSRRSVVGRFDHGAPSFHAHDPRFKRAVGRWQAAGTLSPLETDESSYVGVPAMNAFMKSEAKRLDAEFGVEVGAPLPCGNTYHLFTTSGQPLGDAEYIVFAAPAPQTVDRLPHGTLRDAAASATFDPCWTLLAAWEAGTPVPQVDTSGSTESPFASFHWQAERPDRGQAPRLVAHASARWSWEHIDIDKPTAANALLEAFHETYGALPEPVYLDAHRWRYARVSKPVGVPFGYDPELRFATCGDWHLGPDCEHAWISGHELGQELAKRLA
ncbi:MAG: NAD(P)-binding protein [Pseudomonadota bacterium]